MIEYSYYICSNPNCNSGGNPIKLWNESQTFCPKCYSTTLKKTVVAAAAPVLIEKLEVG